MEDKDSVLKLIKASVYTTDPDAILIFFGSCARNDFRSDSDLDLLQT